jgi:CheY-like chemotaxis protein
LALNPAVIATDRNQMNRPVTVVVADDDDVLRTLLVLNLEAEGLRVHEAENGAKALQFALTHEPDLIVLDVMMPVHDGLKVLRALKDEPATATIPVVLLTARAAADEIEEGWRAGADFYLTKPFHMANLLEIVDELTSATNPA